ncbi:branched-chain amino acid ABC transporter substrate-binding protein [Variovorax paradoxus]|jgi:ABC-type branched-subunit amino acid transport system substrate-binding protein|uniref:ABC transporter substrate-binding protein n=1 Tax=Variovorax paradoxus TaxID=34073 RepID=UPI0006E68CA2|nr:branched-chain amino acid ABC transporter substrate-binding protein [Variovorax paradoxus]KPU88879.1 branched-chain amino acid ABC transporter substrate-binding protein [Variovorax paradoxus]KPU90600.1 branched-chain amino acid ABC transporter substrate-binding protein [Variovorax paradoxus]KPV06097.1 branched-chain amino acid ABC transporter substrate-binding protein [Variovorax paradoxus]KPV30203.1 branched-chain amino acid ABC transporter substrate-binding protein [Variovorax paradoxus]
MTAFPRAPWTRNLAVGAAIGLAALVTHAADPIRIGFTGPLSGSLSLLGSGVRDGLQTVIEKANAQGGVNGRKIELIAEDDGYDPTRTLAAAKKLAEQDKVLALVAPTGTPNVAALVPYATERKLPILSPYAFSNTLTTPTKRYVFTTLPEVRVQANVLGDYLVTELKQKKIAAVYQNDDFGQDAVAGLEARMKKENVPLTKLPFDRGTTNFSGVVAQARQSGADNVVFLGIPRDAALVMKEANKMGWKPQFSGHNALGDPQTFALAGTTLVEGAIAVAVMEPLDSRKPQVAEFMADQKKFLPKTNPTTYSLHGYTAGRIFVEALRSIKGNVDGESLVAALEAMKNYDTGLMAPITFSKEQHAGSLSVAFMRAKEGKWQIVSDWIKAD